MSTFAMMRTTICDLKTSSRPRSCNKSSCNSQQIGRECPITGGTLASRNLTSFLKLVSDLNCLFETKQPRPYWTDSLWTARISNLGRSRKGTPQEIMTKANSKWDKIKWRIWKNLKAKREEINRKNLSNRIPRRNSLSINRIWNRTKRSSLFSIEILKMNNILLQIPRSINEIETSIRSLTLKIISCMNNKWACPLAKKNTPVKQLARTWKWNQVLIQICLILWATDLKVLNLDKKKMKVLQESQCLKWTNHL